MPSFFRDNFRLFMLSITCLGSVYSATIVSQFRSSVDSLLAGDYQPDEIVVVVDGPISSDLDFVIQLYSKYGYIRTVRLSSNQGLANALNAGMSISSSDIICRFDTDDISLPSRLCHVRRAFESDSRLDVFGSAIIEFSVGDDGRVATNLKKVPLRHPAIVKRMRYANPMNHPSVAFRRSSVQAIGGYRHMQYFEDYYLWLLASKAGLRFGNVETPLVCMRRTDLLSRRSGLRYALNEANFYFCCLAQGLISPLLMPLFALRCSSRLLPSFLQSFQSFLPWRIKASLQDCPQLPLWLSSENNADVVPGVGVPYWTAWSRDVVNSKLAE